MKTLTKYLIIMLIPIFLISLWDKYPAIKDTVHGILDPSLGVILKWDILFGFIIIVGIITLIQSLAQKFLTNQEELRRLKKEQKILQEEMKKYKAHPEKLMELQKKQLEFIPKTMDLTMNSTFYTIIPFVLLFKWFQVYLVPAWGNWWILYYFIGSMVFSGIYRKYMNIA
jgi:uncharacterized membrane protein (DUF106 family)